MGGLIKLGCEQQTFGALFWGLVLSSLLGFVRVVCINMNLLAIEPASD